MKVELITPSSNSLEDLQEYIATLSSVVRDKQPKSAEKLFSRLLKESIGDKASRVLEYIPCRVGYGIPKGCRDSMYRLNCYTLHEPGDIEQRFGFWSGKDYYTNARELLNWGWSMDDVLEVIDFTHYKVFKCETPYFIYGQVSTHNQLTTVSHSQRYAECARGYWMPPEVESWFKNKKDNGFFMDEDDAQSWWDEEVTNKSPHALTYNMKMKCKVVRKEVFDRGADMLQNRIFTIGGYTNNPNAWEHFFKQRLDSHTQLETREFASMLYDYKNN